MVCRWSVALAGKFGIVRFIFLGHIVDDREQHPGDGDNGFLVATTLFECMDKTDDPQKRNPEMITILRAEYEEKNARLASQNERISHLENQIDLLLEALRLARHKRFGASSEQSDDSVMEQLSFLFDEAEVYQAAEEEQATVVAEHKRHKKHEYALNHIPDDIPTERVEHRPEDAQLICPRCGEIMTEIGKEVVRTLKIVSAQTIVKEDIYYTYACRNCEKNDIETPVVQAPRERSIIPGGFVTPRRPLLIS